MPALDMAEYMRLYRERNPDYVKSNRKAALDRRAEKKARFIDWLRTQECADCGEDRIVVLELDHVRGEKRESVSRLLNDGYSWEVVEEEIAKCDVVCANCHRIRTAERGSWARMLV